ncbi:serine hydrolase [Marinomonas posidonica]|uniref:serine hydrolase n=1 Tax=Marinomonas posidonica TaxID=936476 RepID=UPI00030ABD11|nr:serine hydrolase [Marinomonas posidonica]
MLLSSKRLTHASDLSYDFSNKNTLKYQEYKIIQPIKSLKKEAFFTPLAADSGTMWEDGISTDWVGRLIETVTNISLAYYLQKPIFIPIGMHNADFKITDDTAKRFNNIHVRNEQGKISATNHVAEQNGEIEEAGGGLYSTCCDFSRLIQMILNKGQGKFGKMLNAEMVELMPQNVIGPLRVKKSKQPYLISQMILRCFPMLIGTWRLGFMIKRRLANQQAVLHGED